MEYGGLIKEIDFNLMSDRHVGLSLRNADPHLGRDSPMWLSNRVAGKCLSIKKHILELNIALKINPPTATICNKHCEIWSVMTMEMAQITQYPTHYSHLSSFSGVFIPMLPIGFQIGST
jgi:hypothetical protein